MKKSAKVLIVTAAALTVAGLVMFVAAMSAYHWDFNGLSTVKYETNTYVINEDFADMVIDTDTADVHIVSSEDGKCRVVCYEREDRKHTAEVRDGRLTVGHPDGSKWYDHIGIDTGCASVTVYLPETEYESLVIKGSTGNIEMPDGITLDSVDISVSTGDIEIGDITAGTLGLSVSTGKVTVYDVTCAGRVTVSAGTGDVSITDVMCHDFLSTGSTGDILLKNVIAEKTLSVQRSTGRVETDGSDASEIYVRTSTGDVVGSILSEKVFVTETSTGNTSVPGTSSGGRCEVVTSTGDIILVLSDGADK